RQCGACAGIFCIPTGCRPRGSSLDSRPPRFTSAPMAETLILSGAPEGLDAALIAREADRGAAENRPVIHVARDDRRMAAMRAALAFFAPQLPVLELPAWDTTPYDRVSPSGEIMAQRLQVLAALA